MNNKILLEAMALDLKRVALGFHSNSIKMAERFLIEVNRRNTQLDKRYLSKSVTNILITMSKRLKCTNTKHLADDALMYSTILLSFSKRI